MARTNTGAGGRATTTDEVGRYEIVVVSNALMVMSSLSQTGPAAINDLVGRTGLSRSATYRILVTLEARGFAVRDRASREWSLGPAFLLAHNNVHRNAVRDVAAPVLRRLHKQFQETVNLAQIYEGRLSYTEILESPQPLAARDRLGDEVPLATTALGRAILSALPTSDPLIETVFAGLAAPGELLSELAAVRERGWAIELGETVVGVACLGAPILGESGLPVGGLSISLPDSRLSETLSAELGRAVRDEARAISQSLSGR